jgi:hypothetical protein
MRYWFQNLKREDREKRLFHFRGSVSTDRRQLFSYSLASGPALRFKYTHGNSDESQSQICLGLVFFTVWFSFNLPRNWYFKRKCIATWDGNKEFYLTDGREYGFYVHDWAIVWCWHQRVHESGGKKPWWRYFYFHIDDFFLGRTEYMTRDLVDVQNVGFKIGDKTFNMNSIRWYDATWFRRRIPLSLYAHKMVRVEMKIEKPPMRAGKGENSWDCGDDGSFGLTMQWKHVRPTWMNVDEVARLAIAEYVDDARKDAKRYGSGSGERGIKSIDTFEYIGRVKMNDQGSSEAVIESKGCARE